MSFGGTTTESPVQAAVQNAAAHGVICVMAAGNNGQATPAYPAGYSTVIRDCIAVGALSGSSNSSTTMMTNFSNRAGSDTPFNFVDAPGNAITGYTLFNLVQSWAGTSMAAPLIAAEIADFLSANMGYTSEQIVSAVVQSTIDVTGISTHSSTLSIC